MTFEKVGLEDNDSEREVFKRRMGMRNYFKELKMNTKRMQETKSQQQQQASA